MGERRQSSNELKDGCKAKGVPAAWLKCSSAHVFKFAKTGFAPGVSCLTASLLTHKIRLKASVAQAPSVSASVHYLRW